MIYEAYSTNTCKSAFKETFLYVHKSQVWEVDKVGRKEDASACIARKPI